jgi:hypothetical protein
VGLQNLFAIYRRYLDSWNLFLNANDARLLAHGTSSELTILEPVMFEGVVHEFTLKL